MYLSEKLFYFTFAIHKKKQSALNGTYFIALRSAAHKRFLTLFCPNGKDNFKKKTKTP
jgi:hypothetical protein